MSQIKVKVEFSGIARILTGRNEFAVDISDNISYEEIITELAKAFPKLIGHIINEDRRSLFPSNVISVNGKSILQPDDMKGSPSGGDTLILLSLLAGG
ncbi:MAG TPA: MoaD/ThiS family protein [Anaerolineae bacterium]|nr:MoaD/ThiS family protein [Anaerolineae bacterium]